MTRLPAKACASLTAMRLDSVQIGSPRPSGGKLFTETGIDKEPVDSIEILDDGVAGDTVVDTKNHGGQDQAVYAYTRDDYDYWEAELDRPMPGGLYGENLTISGIESADVRIGDRFRIGDVELEATASRIPCQVFADKLDIVGFVAEFRDAGRPGIYFRVITAGVVAPGAEITYLPAADTNVTILESYRLHYDRSATKEQLERHLASPLSARTRAECERRLERLGA